MKSSESVSGLQKLQACPHCMAVLCYEMDWFYFSENVFIYWLIFSNYFFLVCYYKALDRGAAMLKVDKLATGHNADDIAETVLLNILRGDIAR